MALLNAMPSRLALMVVVVGSAEVMLAILLEESVKRTRSPVDLKIKQRKHPT